MAESFKLVLVGAGNMGGAMLAGWIEGGFEPGDVTVIDPSPRPDMARKLVSWGVNMEGEPPDGLVADVLLIAVKPQMMDDVLPGLKSLTGPDTVSVSVAAGTTIATLERALGGAVVRAMPNTPSLLQRGITVGCANAAVSGLQKNRVEGLLKATGGVEWVEDEKLIDAVTAVSGSGPAYVFHLAECMAAAGVEQGLPPELANRLARETIAGAGEMLSRLPDEASTLRENVTSPNGTTAAALAVLMKDEAMRKLFSKAIAAARIRSEELS